MITLDPMHIDSVVRMALAEDIGSGDITTALTVPECAQATAVMTAKGTGVIAGMDLVRAVFRIVGGEIEFKFSLSDGAEVNAGTNIAIFTGSTRAILTGERVALNFLQRMSGIATMTARYVDLVSGTKARIIDTRKTTPGLRILEKYAVTVGGGFNHRFGLDDGILIKDNHIEAAGGIANAVAAAKEKAPHTLRIEIEVTSLDQLHEAIAAGADAILLDNMDLETMRQAVNINAGRAVLEASGGVNEDSVAAIAQTGVDLISSGALTHSTKALDISLNITANTGAAQ